LMLISKKSVYNHLDGLISMALCFLSFILLSSQSRLFNHKSHLYSF
jgi:hypothetical protein